MKFRRTLILAALVFPGVLTVSVLSAAAWAGDTTAGANANAAAPGFTALERQLVEKYFGKMPAGAKLDAVPPDAGDGESPPGPAQPNALKSGLARGESLPPDLAQRNLPVDLDEQLPPAPEGHERRIVGDAAVALVNKDTGRVADLITDILIPPADD